MNHLFCFGLGFSGRALGQSLLCDGWRVSGTTRDPEKLKTLEKEGFDVYFFPAEECLIEDQLFSATHMVVTIPPQTEGDIVFKDKDDNLMMVTGRVISADDNCVRLDHDGRELVLDYIQIQKAKVKLEFN